MKAKLFKTKCPKCDKELVGRSEKHLAYILKQHTTWKHERKTAEKKAVWVTQ